LFKYAIAGTEKRTEKRSKISAKRIILPVLAKSYLKRFENHKPVKKDKSKG
jgi:hypothetical protein